MSFYVKVIPLNVETKKGIGKNENNIPYHILYVNGFVLFSDPKSWSIIPPRQLDVGLNIRSLMNSKGAF